MTLLHLQEALDFISPDLMNDGMVIVEDEVDVASGIPT